MAKKNYTLMSFISLFMVTNIYSAQANKYHLVAANEAQSYQDSIDYEEPKGTPSYDNPKKSHKQIHHIKTLLLPKNWSGTYLGLVLSSNRLSVVNDLSKMNISRLKQCGLGGILGVNFENNNIVYGVESIFTFPFSKAYTDTSLSYRKILDADIAARLGYDAGKFLPYIKFGFGNEVSKFSEPAGLGKFKANMKYMLAGGLDYRFMDNIITKVEIYKNISSNGSVDILKNRFKYKDDNIGIRAGVETKF